MNRNKNDVRHEKIIRGLSKLDDNRKCLNCGSVGPQYVCTTFATFVCITCGGVHREFNHRVKSISLSKFSPEEVAALQAGGNQRALEMYFKHWDSKHHPVPDSSNPEKLRDFVKAIYVDQLYAANKAPPPREQGDDGNDRRSSLRSSFLSSHSFEERRSGPPRETHLRTRSEDRKGFDGGSSPPVRSMRELLGDDLPVLRIEPQTQSSTSDSPISRFGTFVGVSSSPCSSQQNSYTENPGLDQQPYVKASTTGWATFDTVPEQPGTVGSWQEVSNPIPEPAWPNAQYHPGLFPPAPISSQFAPQAITTMPRRKSTNPFDLPEDATVLQENSIPSHDEFQFQHPIETSPSSSSMFEAPSMFEAQPWPPDTSYSASRPGNPFA